jgi:hypothetical protein
VEDGADTFRDERHEMRTDGGKNPMGCEERGNGNGGHADFGSGCQKSFHNRVLGVCTREEKEKFQGRSFR